MSRDASPVVSLLLAWTKCVIDELKGVLDVIKEGSARAYMSYPDDYYRCIINMHNDIVNYVFECSSSQKFYDESIQLQTKLYELTRANARIEFSDTLEFLDYQRVEAGLQRLPSPINLWHLLSRVYGKLDYEELQEIEKEVRQQIQVIAESVQSVLEKLNNTREAVCLCNYARQITEENRNG